MESDPTLAMPALDTPHLQSIVSTPNPVSGKRPRTAAEEEAADSSESPSDSKRAAPIACDYCRTNHLKCNGAVRCSHCKKRDLHCVYPIPKKRGPKPGVNSKLKQQQIVRSA